MIGGGADNKYCFHIISDFVTHTQAHTLEKIKDLESALNTIYPCIVQTHSVFQEAFNDIAIKSSDISFILYRFQIAKSLPNDIDVCLCLDVDMLAVDDIRDIFSIDLKDYTIAAVLDEFCNHHRISKNKHNKEKFIFKAPYFNTGFMLINLKKWKEQDIGSQAMKFYQIYSNNIPEQDALNAVIGSNALILPCKWNLQSFLNLYHSEKFRIYADESIKNTISWKKDEYQEALRNPKIVHFGAGKPWGGIYKELDIHYHPFIHPNYSQWWDMAAQTPVFAQELLELKHTLQDKAFIDYTKSLAIKLCVLESKIDKIYILLKHPFKFLISYIAKKF